jgi:hypothetical protein
MIDRFWRRIERALAEPAVIDVSLGHRRVCVLGLAVFDCLPDGTVATSLWKRTKDEVLRESLEPDRIVLDGTPHGTTWLDIIRNDFACDHRERFDADPAIASSYVDWVFESFASYIRRAIDMRAVRATVAEALALDPWVRVAARRLYRRSGRGEVPTTYAAYNRVARHREAFETLDRETPNLIPLFGVFVDEADFPVEGEPAARLKAHLVGKHGLSQRLWRLLAKGRGRLLAEFLPFYRCDNATATIDLLRVLDALGVRALPPRWMLWTLLSHFGDPRARFEAIADTPEFSSPGWRRIVRLMESADAETLESMRINLATVLSWLHDDAEGIAARTFRESHWPCFMRRTGRWKRDQERGRMARLSWDVPIGPMRVGPFRVVPIADGKTMLNEACAMQNCIDSYTDACAEGRALFFSIQSDKADRSHAHLLFNRHDTGWTFVRAAGFRNAPPSPKAEAIARLIALHLNTPQSVQPVVPTSTTKE